MYIISILILLFSIVLLVAGWKNAVKRKNPYGLCRIFNPLGAFVWGDAVPLGIFWIVAAVAFYLVNDWDFVGLVVSIFWAVRAGGEVGYWMLQQFTQGREQKNLWLDKYFTDKSSWFVYQVAWQCVMVAALVASVWFGWGWVGK